MYVGKLAREGSENKGSSLTIKSVELYLVRTAWLRAYSLSTLLCLTCRCKRFSTSAPSSRSPVGGRGRDQVGHGVPDPYLLLLLTREET